VAALAVLALAGCEEKKPTEPVVVKPTIIKPPSVAAAPNDLFRLARAYPKQIARVTGDSIALASGMRIPYANGREGEPFEERLAHASLKDQMSVGYPAGAQFPLPSGDNDPGRLRDLSFFQAMYGSSETQVRGHLAVVRWLGRQDVLMTSVNGVDKALVRVSDTLLRLPPQARACLGRAGAFVYRDIAGTDGLSPHSFGIAIDVGRACSNYWYWDKQRSRDGSFRYINRMPMEIVLAFEREGFIWGGKWAHYDTMHFEYRPELLVH
jgi:hypothetical protein